LPRGASSKPPAKGTALGEVIGKYGPEIACRSVKIEQSRLRKAKVPIGVDRRLHDAGPGNGGDVGRGHRHGKSGLDNAAVIS
jgi:hypothetical protein